MNSKTSKRANHCQQQHLPQRGWLEHGPFLHDEDEREPDESWGSDLLDGMLDDDTPPEDFFDFFN
jgi:hypothetical protein